MSAGWTRHGMRRGMEADLALAGSVMVRVVVQGQGGVAGTSAGSPDGQPVAEPATPLFHVRGVSRLRVGGYPPPQDAPWGLRVVRQLP